MSVYSRFLKPVIDEIRSDEGCRPLLKVCGFVFWLGASLTCADYITKYKESFNQYAKNTNGYAAVVCPDFEEKAKKYLANEGRQLRAYLQQQGREFYELAGIETRGVESSAIASIDITIGDRKAFLVGSRDFERKIEWDAKYYGVTPDIARRHTFDHEMVHLSQKGKCFANKRAKEFDVEKSLVEYYEKLGPEYKPLARISLSRAQKLLADSIDELVTKLSEEK